MEQRIKVNEIKLIGNLGADPEVKYFPSGACKVTARLAVTRKVKEEKVTDWFNIEAWAEVGEALAEQKRGARIGITSGQMINDTWTDKEGKTRDAWKVKVYEWKAMERLDAPASAPTQGEALDTEVPW